MMKMMTMYLMVMTQLHVSALKVVAVDIVLSLQVAAAVVVKVVLLTVAEERKRLTN